ncbi:MAG: M13 family metallopeptidase [Polyangiaceae bacterium]|nr:M13 family metallopeptidase [Polyangiaceae bacterium]
MRSRSVVLASVGLSFALGCASSSPEPISSAGPVPLVIPPPNQGPPPVHTTLAAVGLDGAAIDRTADPCKDFYQFACGGWIASTEIPSDAAMWVRSFSEINKRNETALKAILEDAASAKNPDPATQKIGDYFAACMDEAAVDAAGAEPIKDLISRARSVSSGKDAAAFVADLHRRMIFPIFTISGEQDFGDATRVIAYLDQGGLGLPDRDYYTKDDDEKKRIRKAYVEHVERMLVLAGFNKKTAPRAAEQVLETETEIAKVSKTNVERRDPKKQYNLLSRNDLAKKAPQFPWDGYFKTLGIGDVKQVNVTSVAFFEGLDKLLTTVKPDAWQSYLAYHVAKSTAKYLSKAFVEEDFVMRKLLTGQKENKPRWKRCVAYTDHALGELLAQPFVSKYFGGESKRAAEQMVQEISKAFAVEVKSLDWMDDKTREKAIAKLEAMEYLIGYPAKWRSYDFKVDRKKFATNALTSNEHEQKRVLTKIDKPVDRGEWLMSPAMVNAYYDWSRNQMVFPAGILQPPFYDVKAATYVNLGAIGMVVGHELTHGFDDEGSQFAANGNLENWWQPEVAKKFEDKTSCVAQQYSSYEAIPGRKVNGELTLGENIADLGGMKLAFMAYRQLRKGAANMTVADGFTEDQQFFLAAGQAWCAKGRDEYLSMLVQTDPHSPPKFRVNGSVSSTPEFAQAFSCSEGSPMRPAKACSVW